MNLTSNFLCYRYYCYCIMTIFFMAHLIHNASANITAIPNITTTSSSLLPNETFYPIAANWRVFVGPNSQTSGVEQNWPAGKTPDPDASSPRLFCFNPHSTPSPSTSSNVTFDSLNTFACYNGPVKFNGKGADGEPLDNCGEKQGSYGVQPSFATGASTAAQNTMTNSGGGCAPFKLAPISGTFVDWNSFGDGSIDDGFTVTFGAQCSSSTRGLAFAAVDNWYEESTNKDLVANVLQTTLENYVGSLNGTSIEDSDVKLVNWDLTGIYAVYFAVYFDARENTILFVSTNEDNEKLQVLRYGAPAAVFDGQWHQIALVATKTEGAYSTIRLFVDAATAYSGESRLNFQRCTESDLSTLVPPVSEKPLKTLVTSTMTEAVYEGGTFSSFVGTSPPAIFNLQFHSGALRAVELASLGSQDMLNNLAFTSTAAIIIGSILAFATLVILVMGIWQVKTEALGSNDDDSDDDSSEEQEQDDPNFDAQETFESNQGSFENLVQTASKMSLRKSFQLVRRLVAMLTPLLAVFQQIALLFRGFSFPDIFEEPLSYITFIFSFQFNIPELGFTIPTWTPLAMLGVIAIIAVIVVLFFGWRDNEVFLETLKRYEILTKTNAEYAAQVVTSFASTKEKAISSETAERDGLSIAQNGWILEIDVVKKMLGSVSESTAARVAKELGPRPRNPVEAIIRRILLISRSKTCPPQLARDTASLILALSADEEEDRREKNEVEENKNAPTTILTDTSAAIKDESVRSLSVEEISACFRKAGLSCTAKEARYVMFEILEAANEPSAVDEISLSGKTIKQLAYLKQKKLDKGEDVDDPDEMTALPVEAVACLAAEEKDGPSRDPESKRIQHEQFRRAALKLFVHEAPFFDQYVDVKHDDGRTWNDIIKAANNLASFDKVWPIAQVKLMSGTILHNAILSLPKMTDKEREEAIKETGTLPPQEFTLTASVGEPNAEPKSMKLKFQWETPLRCPTHDTILMKASDSAYLQTDEEKKPIYDCCYQKLSCVKTQNGLGPCRTDTLLICSEETCTYSICLSCSDPGFFSEKRIELNTSWVNLKRDPSAAVSLIAFLGLQGVYLPITQNAMMILACHPTTQCEYPTCFDPLSDAMLTASIVAGVSLLLVTIGLPLYWWVSAKRRAILSDRVLVSPTQWEEFLEMDETALANIYNKFEFDYITFEPFLMVSRSVALVCAVAFTEPESLAQMLAVAGVTLFNAILMSYTAPFIDPWIDVLTKTDMLYSCGQVALLCFEQVARITSPIDQEETIGIIMLLWGAFFFICYFAIFYKTIIRAYLDHRALSRAREIDREEEMWLRDSSFERRLKNLEKLLETKEEFYGKDHFQCAITRAHMAQSCISDEQQRLESNACGELFVDALSRELSILRGDEESSELEILAEFSFRKSHWENWCGGHGLTILGDVIRLAENRQEIIKKLTEFLSVDTKARSPYTNAFSLLVNLRVPFEKINFSDKNLTQVFGRGAIFRECNFTKANLMGVNFTNSTFSNCDFTDAFVTGAIFGPEHKTPVESVWSTVVHGVSMPHTYGEDMPMQSSINCSGTLLAVSGFGRYFTVLDSKTGKCVATSNVLTKPSNAPEVSDEEQPDDPSEKRYCDDGSLDWQSGALYERYGPHAFDEKSYIEAVFVPTDEHEIFVYCKHYLFRVTIDVKKKCISDFENPFDDTINQNKKNTTRFQFPISTIQFSPSGDRFVMSPANAEWVILCETSTLHQICRVKANTFVPFFFTPFSDDLFISSSSQDISTSLYLVSDMSERVRKHSSLSLTSRKNLSSGRASSGDVGRTKKEVDLTDTIPTILFYASQLLFLLQDGSGFVALDQSTNTIDVRSFNHGDEKVDYQHSNLYYQDYREKNPSSSSSGSSSSSPGDAPSSSSSSTNDKNSDDGDDDEDDHTTTMKVMHLTEEKHPQHTRCSFRVPSWDQCSFFEMPDGNSLLVVFVKWSEHQGVGQAKLYSLISGAELGTLDFSFLPPRSRFSYVDDETYHNIISDFSIDPKNMTLDPSGLFLYISTAFNNVNDSVFECYVLKIPLSFSSEREPERALIKSIGWNNVSRATFASDSRLVVASKDKTFRVMSVCSSDDGEFDVIKESKSSSPSKSFKIPIESSHVAIQSSNSIAAKQTTIAALSGFSRVHLVNVETGEALGPALDSEEEATFKKLDNTESTLKMSCPQLVAVSNDGTLVAATDTQEMPIVFLWSTEVGQQHIVGVFPLQIDSREYEEQRTDDDVDDYYDDEETAEYMRNYYKEQREQPADMHLVSAKFESIQFFNNDQNILAINSHALCAIVDVKKRVKIYEGPLFHDKQVSLSSNIEYHCFPRNGLMFVCNPETGAVDVFSESALARSSKNDTPKSITSFSFPRGYENVSMSLDGSTIATASHKFINVYDVICSSTTTTTTPIVDCRFRVAISVEEKEDEEEEQQQQIDDDELVVPQPNQDWVRTCLEGCDRYASFSLSHDGNALAFVSSYHLHIYDTKPVPRPPELEKALCDISSSSETDLRNWEMQTSQTSSTTTSPPKITSVLATDMAQWVVYRGDLTDPDSRNSVRAVDLSAKKDTEEQRRARQREEMKQEARRQQLREERRKKALGTNNNNSNNNQLPLLPPPTRKMRASRPIALHQKLNFVPASVVFRRILTSAFLTRYINNCVIQHVEDFCTSPSPDKIEFGTIDAIRRDLCSSFFAKIEKVKSKKEAKWRVKEMKTKLIGEISVLSAKIEELEKNNDNTNKDNSKTEMADSEEEEGEELVVDSSHHYQYHGHHNEPFDSDEDEDEEDHQHDSHDDADSDHQHPCLSICDDDEDSNNDSKDSDTDDDDTESDSNVVVVETELDTLKRLKTEKEDQLEVLEMNDDEEEEEEEEEEENSATQEEDDDEEHHDDDDDDDDDDDENDNSSSNSNNSS